MSTETQRVPKGRGEVWWPRRWPLDSSEAAVDVLIPALDEEGSLPHVLSAIPDEWVRRVTVVDNGSTDDTGRVARRGGAELVEEPRRGYGAACLRGLAHLEDDPPDIVVFLDADYSDRPSELPRVVAPLVEDVADLAVGTRTVGPREGGALEPQARFGNRFACLLMEVLTGYRFTDLGPFRAVRWETLQMLDMRDRDFGWTVEMQAKAAFEGVDAVEVPVSYRRRHQGQSKVSGTLKGSLLAGAKILSTIAKVYAERGEG